MYKLSIWIFDALYFLAHVAALIVLAFLALLAMSIDPRYSRY